MDQWIRGQRPLQTIFILFHELAEYQKLKKLKTRGTSKLVK